MPRSGTTMRQLSACPIRSLWLLVKSLAVLMLNLRWQGRSADWLFRKTI